MNLEISTTQYQAIAHRIQPLVVSCNAWLLEARAAASYSQSGIHERLDISIQLVARVTDRLERCIHDLIALAKEYDDHESTAQQQWAAVALLGLASPFGLAVIGLVGGVGHAVIRQPTARATVSVHRDRWETLEAPQSYGDVLSRIPQGDDQIRIDCIDTGGEPIYVVYISGTRDFSLLARTQPWDMTSNVAAITGAEPSASERAVREAMAQAGIAEGARVMLVGHSQGGLIASRIAQSRDFEVTDLVLAGSPTRGFEIDPKVRVTQIEHTNDPIPMLSGVAVATSALTVRTFSANSAGSGLMSAHDVKAYAETAREMDRSGNPALKQRKTAIFGELESRQTDTQWFRAERNTAVRAPG